LNPQLSDIKTVLFETNLYLVGFFSFLIISAGFIYGFDFIIIHVFSGLLFLSSITLLVDKNNYPQTRQLVSFLVILIGCLPAITQTEYFLLLQYLFAFIFIQAVIGYFTNDFKYGVIYVGITTISYSLYYYLIETQPISIEFDGITSTFNNVITVLFLIYCFYTFFILNYVKKQWELYRSKIISQEQAIKSSNSEAEVSFKKLQKIRQQFNRMDKYLTDTVVPVSNLLKKDISNINQKDSDALEEFSRMAEQLDSTILDMDTSLRVLNELTNRSEDNAR
jgi:hypothetical protein